MRRIALGLALMLLAGCGGADDVGEGNASANQIARLATPAVEPVSDPLVLARLQPLDAGDVTHGGVGGPNCSFSRDGRLLVAANAGDAIARIDGHLLHFSHSAPVGPSGGFLEDRHTSISIGRTDAAEVPDRALAGWPARATVTNRRTGAQTEQDGLWRCDPS